MFNVLVLQAPYGLSHDQTEFQLRDRLSFMRFLGLRLHDRVPGAKTIWLYRELPVRAKGRPFFEQAGLCAMRLEMRRVDHHGSLIAAMSRAASRWSIGFVVLSEVEGSRLTMAVSG